MHYQLSYIWSNILLEAKKNVEILLVCGAAPKEGNTFISFHLAMFLSREYNWRILYVDTNPNHAVFSKMKDLPGLYSYVSEKKELGSLVVQTEYPGLYLLPSGAGTTQSNGCNSTLSSESILTLNNFCRNNFDVTIIDGQTVTNSPVMVELAKTVDMTALVCRYGYSRREVSRAAIDRLQKYGVTSIGVILNDRQYPIPQKLYKMLG
jgi:Mrp family chromosome partitioning ATPase